MSQADAARAPSAVRRADSILVRTLLAVTLGVTLVALLVLALVWGYLEHRSGELHPDGQGQVEWEGEWGRRAERLLDPRP